jgi:TM2 domain-containing membrane protein YozV
MQTNELKGIEMRNRHRQVFEESTEKYEGQLLQYFGDGTLSIFDSSTDAIECAVEMQRKFKGEPKVPLRIGVHTGEIVFNEDEAFGHALNVAARIEPICITGGVYLTGKVQEDINNHPWIRSISLGLYELKNINEAIEVFAVTNEGVDFPVKPRIQEPQNKFKKKNVAAKRVSQSSSKKVGDKKRMVAAILAFIFGVFGIHRFYLGQRGLGIAYFVSFMIGIISEGEAWFLIMLPAVLGLIDSIILFSISNLEFDRKYNGLDDGQVLPDIEYEEEEEEYEDEVYEDDWRIEQEYDEELSNLPLADQAAQAVRKGNYWKAIQLYHTLLENDPEDKNLHFSLTVCYSMNQDAKNGFYHLSKAVEYGYDDYQKIDNHFTLAFLRSRKEFASFAKQGYRLVKMLPSPEDDLLSTDPPLLLKKLEKLETLGDKLERGEISEKEFSVEKQKLLNN